MTTSSRCADSTRTASLAQSRPSGVRRRGTTTRLAVAAGDVEQFAEARRVRGDVIVHEPDPIGALGERRGHAAGEASGAPHVPRQEDGLDLGELVAEQIAGAVAAGIVDGDDEIGWPRLGEHGVEAPPQERRALERDDHDDDALAHGRRCARPSAARRAPSPGARTPRRSATCRRRRWRTSAPGGPGARAPGSARSARRRCRPGRWRGSGRRRSARPRPGAGACSGTRGCGSAGARAASASTSAQ